MRGLGADVGGGAAGDAHKLIERRGEDVMRMPARSPHLAVLAEVDVDERPDRRRVADRSDAACGLCNPSRGGL